MEPRDVKRRPGVSGKTYADFFMDGLKYDSENRYRNALAGSSARNATTSAFRAVNTDRYQRAKTGTDLRMRDLQEEKFEIEKGEKLLKALSSRFSPIKDPDGTKFQLFMSQDQGKMVAKEIKKTIPERVDESGNIVLISEHDLMKDQLDEQNQTLQARIPFLSEKLKDPKLDADTRASIAKQLTEDIDDANKFSLYKDHDLYANAVNATLKDNRLNQQDHSNEDDLIAEHYQAFKSAKTKLMGGAQEEEPQAQQPEQNKLMEFLSSVMGGAMSGGAGTGAMANQQRPQQAPINIPTTFGDDTPVQNPQGMQVNQGTQTQLSPASMAQQILAKRNRK